MLKTIFSIWMVYVIIRLVFGRKKGATGSKGTAQADRIPETAATFNAPTINSSTSFEGESSEEHERHLMKGTNGSNVAEGEPFSRMTCPQEGESEDEHAMHMTSADRVEVLPKRVILHSSAVKLSREDLRRSLIMREILDPPISLRRRQQRTF